MTLFTSKCASRHNGVQFFLPHLPRCLRTRAYSSTPRSHKTLENNSVSRLPYLFAHLHLLNFSTSPRLSFCVLECLSICPYCRKFSFQTSFGEYLIWDCVWESRHCAAISSICSLYAHFDLCQIVFACMVFECAWRRQHSPLAASVRLWKQTSYTTYRSAAQLGFEMGHIETA